jgi:uracil-DNA glycosylase
MNHLEGWLPEGAVLMKRKRSSRTRLKITDIPVSAAVASDSLDRVAADLHDCTRCKLSAGRTNIVLSDGNPQSPIFFVGEGPGEKEDLTGKPFVGRSGQLLDRMIVAMGLDRSKVFIANIVKCRPPENRAPEVEEVATCIPFLERQIRLVRPKVVVALGKSAAQALLRTAAPIGDLRTQIHPFEMHGVQMQLIATFHPAYLLRNPPAKKEAWKDLQLAMGILGLEKKELV